MAPQHEPEFQQVSVKIAYGPVSLDGLLGMPVQASGMVLFAHGSGSGRLSPRNHAVANHFHDIGLATLLFDLLTPLEAEDRRKVFDIDLLATRFLLARDWLAADPRTNALPVGYFGASTGAAAALQAAAREPDKVKAVVSRGGRPDLAGVYLSGVAAPTLFLVGEQDAPVMELHRSVLQRLTCTNEFAIIPGAGHLFEEPGALDHVAERAGQWFVRYMVPISAVRHSVIRDRRDR